MYIWFLGNDLACSDLKCKENRQYHEHFSHTTQQCKDIHSKGQTEIFAININSYPANSKKKVLGAYSDLINIFVNF